MPDSPTTFESERIIYDDLDSLLHRLKSIQKDINTPGNDVAALNRQFDETYRRFNEVMAKWSEARRDIMTIDDPVP